MKKIQLTLLPAIIASIFMWISCSPSKVSSVSGTSTNIRGTWTVTDVTITGTDAKNLNITAFDEGDFTCFKGSTWVLQPSGNGSYSINNENCGSRLQNIFWSVDNKKGAEYFRFKKLGDKVKPSQVADGYEMLIQQLDDHSLVLSTPVIFEGNTISINYQLTR